MPPPTNWMGTDPAFIGSLQSTLDQWVIEMLKDTVAYGLHAGKSGTAKELNRVATELAASLNAEITALREQAAGLYQDLGNYHKRLVEADSDSERAAITFAGRSSTVPSEKPPEKPADPNPEQPSA